MRELLRRKAAQQTKDDWINLGAACAIALLVFSGYTGRIDLKRLDRTLQQTAPIITFIIGLRLKQTK